MVLKLDSNVTISILFTSHCKYFFIEKFESKVQPKENSHQGHRNKTTMERINSYKEEKRKTTTIKNMKHQSHRQQGLQSRHNGANRITNNDKQ